MYVKLSIPERLKDLRVERHLTLEQLAAETGLSKSALGKYEADDYKDISPFAIAELAKFYGVSTDYLMGLTETKNHPNTALHELHLSDEMIDVLRDGKLNNRLLCEIVAHEGFEQFLVDTEIYIDRIVDMRIKDMNTVLDAARQQVIQAHDPGESDLYVRTLELAQVNEDEYFCHVIHQDMDKIIRDIREAHKTDSLTADETSPASEVQKQLHDAMHYAGSAEEKRVRVYLASLGIDYDALTPEEVFTQIAILKKSKHLRSPVIQRGRASSKQKKRK